MATAAKKPQVLTPIEELRLIQANYKTPEGGKIDRKWLTTFYGCAENTVHKWFMKTGKTRFTAQHLKTLKLGLGLIKPRKAIRIR